MGKRRPRIFANIDSYCVGSAWCLQARIVLAKKIDWEEPRSLSVFCAALYEPFWGRRMIKRVALLCFLLYSKNLENGFQSRERSELTKPITSGFLWAKDACHVFPIVSGISCYFYREIWYDLQIPARAQENSIFAFRFVFALDTLCSSILFC